MSSEHAIEQVPLSEIREGDMLQDPKSGNWIKVTHTSDGATSITRKYSDEERYRVYYGDGGEEIDSRFVTGLVNRQVRE
jgi:tagatose-1,6-bisphosphate aldolase non-catalytic subunit AgaZ/GatZ